MTTFPEIDIQISVTEYLKGEGETQISLPDYFTISSYVGRKGYSSIDVLNWIHPTIPKPTEQQLISLYDVWKSDYDSSISLEQNRLLVEESASSDIDNIPGWATWTQAQAAAWLQTNLNDSLPVASLAEANAVLQVMSNIIEKQTIMLLALRNKVYPDKQG